MRQTAPAQPSPASSLPGSRAALSGKDADSVEEDFPQEDEPGRAGKPPRDENEGHRQLRQLGFLIPSELHELGPPIDEHHGKDQNEEVGDDFQQSVGAPPQFRPDVDLEMR